MPTITIYTKPACPYCNAAKAIISSKGQKWTEINVEADDMRELDETKKLDALLA